eukprot:g6280.t1
MFPGWCLRCFDARLEGATCSARWWSLRRCEVDPRSAILWLPGGAFLLRVPTCPIFAQRIWSALLAAELPRLPGILELRYTLPADADTTLVQVQDALRYLRNEGYEKVILAGDSAGGYLSLRALLEGSEGVVGALAICPWLDLALSAPSLQRNRSQASESSRPAGTDPALQSPLRRYLEV